MRYFDRISAFDRESGITMRRCCLSVFLCFLSYFSLSYGQEILVSLVELLANPEEALVDFPEGVSTVGYLRFDRGGRPWLFLTRDHALADDIGSALALVDDTGNDEIYDMQCDNEYVRLIGFVTFADGALSFSKIRSIQRTEDRSFCFRRESD